MTTSFALMVLPHEIGALQVDDEGHPEGHHEHQRVAGGPARNPQGVAGPPVDHGEAMTSQVHLPPWAGLDAVIFQYLLYRVRALPPRLRFAAFRGLPSHTEKSYGFHALYPLPLLAECMLRTISVSCLIDRVTGRPYSEGPRGRQPALCGDMFDFHPGALGSTCTPRSLFSAASRCTPPKCLVWCTSTPTCP